ncbi:MAG: hypothetical protein H6Q36_1012 [Chloroflexi bacterium]|nr:hypothetical protein [Chloroflexota bacterium]
MGRRRDRVPIDLADRDRVEMYEQPIDSRNPGWSATRRSTATSGFSTGAIIGQLVARGAWALRQIVKPLDG